MALRGKPFTKGDPRAAKGRSMAGRPRKTVTWKEAEKELREALPRILLMAKNELKALLESNPTGVEMLAAKYLHEHVPAAVDRMLGKTPTPLTGKDGTPLIPKTIPILPPIEFTGKLWEGPAGEARLNAFIAATAAAGKKAT